MGVYRITFKSLAVAGNKPFCGSQVLAWVPEGVGYLLVKNRNKVSDNGLEAAPALVLSPEVVNLPAQAFDGSRDVVDIIAGDWLCLVDRRHGWGAGLTPRVWTIW